MIRFAITFLVLTSRFSVGRLRFLILNAGLIFAVAAILRFSGNLGFGVVRVVRPVVFGGGQRGVFLARRFIGCLIDRDLSFPDLLRGISRWLGVIFDGFGLPRLLVRVAESVGRFWSPRG
ncbi:MAG: hypothetical protein R2849_19500 [Thermomicrobiales bacterium]